MLCCAAPDSIADRILVSEDALNTTYALLFGWSTVVEGKTRQGKRKRTKGKKNRTLFMDRARQCRRK